VKIISNGKGSKSFFKLIILKFAIYFKLFILSVNIIFLTIGYLPRNRMVLIAAKLEGKARQVFATDACLVLQVK
jgi:hypothetical protein